MPQAQRMERAKKEERLQARVTPAQKDLIERAAEIPRYLGHRLHCGVCARCCHGYD